MKKKGFTLVELLAVIAILAILVILVLPNVIGTFNKSNKDVFENEVRNVFMAAQNQSVLDSYDGLNTVYASDATQLDINTKSSFKYCVVVGADGEIEKMYVSNGKYYFESNSQISKSDITSNKINVITGEDTITGIDNCMGSSGNGESNPDPDEPTIPDTPDPDEPTIPDTPDPGEPTIPSDLTYTIEDNTSCRLITTQGYLPSSTANGFKISVGLGEMPTEGYSVTISSVNISSSGVVINATSTSPGTNQTIQKTTYPCAVVTFNQNPINYTVKLNGRILSLPEGTADM